MSTSRETSPSQSRSNSKSSPQSGEVARSARGRPPHRVGRWREAQQEVLPTKWGGGAKRNRKSSPQSGEVARSAIGSPPHKVGRWREAPEGLGGKMVACSASASTRYRLTG